MWNFHQWHHQPLSQEGKLDISPSGIATLFLGIASTRYTTHNTQTDDNNNNYQLTNSNCFNANSELT